MEKTTKTKRQRRRKGDGSISKLKSGNLSMTITIGTRPDGKQVRKRVSAPTLAELQDKAAELRMKYNVLTPQEKRVMLRKTTYQEFSEQVTALQALELTDNSMLGYKSIDKKYLYPTFGMIALKDITPDMIDHFFIHLLTKTELSPTTIKGIKLRFNSILNKAVKQDKLLVNPMTKVNFTIPTKKNKAATFILPSEADVKRMLRHLKDKYPELYPVVFLAVMSGMRRGELLGLKWSAIDFKKHTIRIDNQVTAFSRNAELKTSSSYRTIHISEKMLTVLQTLPRTSEFVFLNRLGHPMTYYSLDRLGRIFHEELGLPEEFTLHDLRHFHATQLLKHNVNIKVVSRRLGHADVSTTLDLYFNYMPEMDEEASVVLDGTLGE